MFTEDYLLTILQIIAVGSAVITTMGAGIKYMRKKFQEDIDSRIDPKIQKVREEHDQLHTEVTAIQKMLEFFSKFIVKSENEDQVRDLRDKAREKEYDEGWGNNKRHG